MEEGITWVCKDCNHEWKEDYFITPGDCPNCESEYIEHY